MDRHISYLDCYHSDCLLFGQMRAVCFAFTAAMMEVALADEVKHSAADEIACIYLDHSGIHQIALVDPDRYFTMLGFQVASNLTSTMPRENSQVSWASSH